MVLASSQEFNGFVDLLIFRQTKEPLTGLWEFVYDGVNTPCNGSINIYPSTVGTPRALRMVGSGTFFLYYKPDNSSADEYSPSVNLVSGTYTLTDQVRKVT